MSNLSLITALFCIFLTSLSSFAGPKYCVSVAVARVLLPSRTSEDNEPIYKKSAIFPIPNPLEIANMFNGNEYLYFSQTSELLFGEEICPYKMSTNYYESILPASKLWGLINKKDTAKKESFISPNLVTINPLIILETEDENIKIIPISMGTKLHSIDAYKDLDSSSVYKLLDEYEIDTSHIIKLDSAKFGRIGDKNDACEIDALKRLSKQEKRTKIINQARKLIGQPYQWGGKAALEGHGYDCAALVQIAYLTGAGIDIPRAVFEQAEYGKQIRPDDLEPGDLLFTLWHMTNGRILPIHVMIWVGDNMLIEASPISMTVRKASVEEVFYGLSLHEIKDGQQFFANEKMRSVQFRRFQMQ